MEVTRKDIEVLLRRQYGDVTIIWHKDGSATIRKKGSSLIA